MEAKSHIKIEETNVIVKKKIYVHVSMHTHIYIHVYIQNIQKYRVKMMQMFLLSSPV